MNLNDKNPEPQVTSIKMYVYEGDIVKDKDGNITNKLREVIEHSAPTRQAQCYQCVGNIGGDCDLCLGSGTITEIIKENTL